METSFVFKGKPIAIPTPPPWDTYLPAPPPWGFPCIYVSVFSSCRDVSTLNFELPTVEDYFRDLVNRVEVTFYNRSDSSDPGFTLILNQKMTYTQVAVAVADYIKEDMKFIQFFKPSHL